MNTTIKIYNGAAIIGEYKLIGHETATLVFDEVREAIKLCQPNVRSWDSQKSVEEELRDLRELRSKVFCKLDFALSDIPNYAVDRGYYSK